MDEIFIPLKNQDKRSPLIDWLDEVAKRVAAESWTEVLYMKDLELFISTLRHTRRVLEKFASARHRQCKVCRAHGRAYKELVEELDSAAARHRWATQI